MKPGLCLLLACALPAQAVSPLCGDLKFPARKLKLDFPPSVPNAKNCAKIGDVPSNYVLGGDPDSPVELHVLSVGEGSFPADLAKGDPDAPEKAVRVVVYRTEKPAVLFLNAEEGVAWIVTVNQDANLDRIIVQGRRPQKVSGVPPHVPVIHRPSDEVCAWAHGWEKKFNRRGGNFKLMISSIRCAAGLREESFQACASGALFEVPHYRLKDKPPPLPIQEPLCPVSAAADARLSAYGLKPGLSAQKRAPAAHEKRAPLPAPQGVSRADIPVRALAILLEGNMALATHDAVPDLVVALKKGDVLLRFRAADALGGMGPEAEGAVDALILALRADPDARVRASAALALGNIGEAAAKAIPHLKHALESDAADLRVSAETALERIGTEKALKILRKRRGRRN